MYFIFIYFLNYWIYFFFVSHGQNWVFVNCMAQMIKQSITKKNINTFLCVLFYKIFRF